MPRLLIPLSCCLAVAGCAPADMNDMMDGMGGRRADMHGGSPVDLGLDGAADMVVVDAGWPGPPLTVHHLALRGSYQSFHLLDPPLQPGTDFEHPDFPTQLGGQGLRGLHFNVFYNTSDVFEVFNHGFVDLESRCFGDIEDCFAPVGEWSRAHPNHAPIVVVIDKLLYEDVFFDARIHVMHREIRTSFDRDQLFTMDDLRALHPGMTIREIITGPGWPDLDAMRGKFVFVLAEPRARTAQRELLWNLDQEPELLMWLYADGTSDDELAADDAAIALFGPIEDDAAAARLSAVADQGFLTWTPAHDAATYARAAGAGAHIIVSKHPDDLFSAPGDEGWPVACNPRTAPPGCDHRQIENVPPR